MEEKFEEHKDDRKTEPFSMPRLGDQAPEFTARTTQGKINFPQDYAGSWVILFSHPADFTPVCTTEFMTFAAMQNKFEEANCKLIGISIDSLFSHIAWLRTIKEKIAYRGMSDVDINFPVIEDTSRVVSELYGVIHPKEDPTQAVRAVFFINPRGKICATMHYPLHLGRNFDELYRALIAMKTAYAFKVSTPANWQPGDDVVLSPPGTTESAKERMSHEQNGVACPDWFLCLKKLDKKEVLDTVLNAEEKIFFKNITK